MDIDRATELAQTTNYAHEAVEEDNPINWADAGAFFLEGYLYAQQQRGEWICKRCGIRQNSNQEPPTF